MNKQKIIAALGTEIESLTNKLNEFAEEVKQNPLHALEWADSSFGNAAKLNIYKRLFSRLTSETNPSSLEDIRVFATKQVLNGAKFPSRSTSVCSNLINQCELEAWADSLDRLSGILFLE